MDRLKGTSAAARYVPLPRIGSPTDHLRTPVRLRRVPLLLAIIATCSIAFLGAKVLHLPPFFSQSDVEDMSDIVDYRSSPLLVRPDNQHRIFTANIPPPTSPQPRPIAAYTSMSDDCADTWISQGIWDSQIACAAPNTNIAPTMAFDAVWAWVNGSDPAQVASRSVYKPVHGAMDARHRYTDHGELRYSIRSLMKSAEPFVRRLHILASAYPASSSPHSKDRPPTHFVGQRPYWLNEQGTDRIMVHHDTDYFAPISTNSSVENTMDFHRVTLPSFNSIAVESQMHNLPHPATDQMVYLNDDFFHLRTHTFSDYFSPLFGPVIRSQVDWKSLYRPVENSWYSRMGETAAIERATWVLSKRFTFRRRPYVSHHARSLSIPLLHETVSSFPEELGNTTLARFRADEDAPPGLQAVFLSTWFVPERHREALLWSYLVARWGSKPEYASDDIYDPTSDMHPIDRIWSQLSHALVNPQKLSNLNGRLPSIIDVRLPTRDRVPSPETWESAGMESPKGTRYQYSSNDGYCLGYLSQLFFWDRPRAGWPDFSPTDELRRPYLCTLRRDECFGPTTDENGNPIPMDQVFKRVAFENNGDCGDCLISALINVSGPRGFDAFLPRHVNNNNNNKNDQNQHQNEKRQQEQQDFAPITIEEEQEQDIGIMPIDVHEPTTPDQNGNNVEFIEDDSSDNNNDGQIINADANNEHNQNEQTPQLNQKPHVSPSTSFPDLPPHLPLAPTWQQVDFSLSNVLKDFQGLDTDLRAFCVRLIQRYQYAMGSTPSMLYQMEYADKIRSKLEGIDRNEKLSMLALNDDIEDDEEKVDRVVQDWFSRRWPDKMEWEIDNPAN